VTKQEQLAWQFLFRRIRTALSHMHEGGALNSIMSERDQLANRTNEKLFAKTDEELIARGMDIEQIIRYTANLEAQVSALLYEAIRTHDMSVSIVAASCRKTTLWVREQIKWRERVLLVNAALETQHNRSELMALAWAIAHN
jgi:hypothetical protein